MKKSLSLNLSELSVNNTYDEKNNTITKTFQKQRKEASFFLNDDIIGLIPFSDNNQLNREINKEFNLTENPAHDTMEHLDYCTTFKSELKALGRLLFIRVEKDLNSDFTDYNNFLSLFKTQDLLSDLFNKFNMQVIDDNLFLNELLPENSDIDLSSINSAKLFIIKKFISLSFVYMQKNILASLAAKKENEIKQNEFKNNRENFYITSAKNLEYFLENAENFVLEGYLNAVKIYSKIGNTAVNSLMKKIDIEAENIIKKEMSIGDLITYTIDLNKCSYSYEIIEK